MIRDKKLGLAKLFSQPDGRPVDWWCGGRPVGKNRNKGKPQFRLGLGLVKNTASIFHVVSNLISISLYYIIFCYNISECHTIIYQSAIL